MQGLKLLMVENGRGGYSHYTRDLCGALGDRHCRVVHLASLDYDLPIPEGCDVRRLLHPNSPALGITGKYGFVARKVLASLRNFFIIRRFAACFDPDVIHFQLTTPIVDAYLLARLRARWPIVLTAHDVIPHHGESVLSRPSHLRRLYLAVDRVIVHSPINRDTIVDVFGVPEEQIAVIPHGTRATVPIYPKHTARQRLQLPESDQIVLCLGVLRRNKRLNILIEACAALFARQDGIRLVIAGTTQDISPEQVRNMLSKHGIMERTTANFTWITEEALDLHLDACDVCVLPYANFYAQSGILMRALAHGTPSIVADGGSLAAFVTEGDVGLAFPADDTDALADRIQSILNSDMLMQRFHRNARRLAKETYDWPIVAGKTADLYQSLIENGSKRRRPRLAT